MGWNTGKLSGVSRPAEVAITILARPRLVQIQTGFGLVFSFYHPCDKPLNFLVWQNQKAQIHLFPRCDQIGRPLYWKLPRTSVRRSWFGYSAL